MSAVSILRRMSAGVHEPSLVEVGRTEPEYANPFIHIQGIGHFYMLGNITLKEAREIGAELEAGIRAARSQGERE